MNLWNDQVFFVNVWSDGGSDSSGSDGLPIHLQYMSAQVSHFL